MNLRLTGRRVLVLPYIAPKTPGGLFLRESLKTLNTGEIIAVSPTSAKEHPELEIGKRCFFLPYHTRNFRWRGQIHKLMATDQVLGVFESVDAG